MSEVTQPPLTEKPHETVVLATHHHPSSRLQHMKDRFPRLFSNPVKIGLMLLLVAAIPLTIIQGMTRQDLSQHASTPPDQDWTKCPVLSYGQPGTLDVDSAIKGENDFNNANPKDPTARFGRYFPSTDPNDPFFTDAAANGEGRWAGDSRRDAGTPYYHGGPYRADGEGGDSGKGIYYRVGGWGYLGFQDTNLLEMSGHVNILSNWNRVMGWTENILSGDGYAGSTSPITRDGQVIRGAAGGWYGQNNPTLDKKGKFINRNCVLNTQIHRLMSDYKNSGKEALFGYNKASGFFIPAQGVVSVANVSVKETAASSPSLPSTPASSDTGLRAINNTAADDKNACRDRTFSDIPASDADLQTATTCLGTATYCTVRGFADGTLGPEEIVTRDQFVAFIARYHIYVIGDWKAVDLSTITNLYTDVPTNYGNALEIYTARENKFITAADTFNPSDTWKFGFHGVTKDGTFNGAYDFTKIGATITRSALIKSLYQYMVEKNPDKAKACGATEVTAANASPVIKDPAPFVEVTADTENRTKVCGANASLLAGHITAEPSVRVFNNALYVFAKGNDDELYMRKLTPAVNGTLANLASSPWIDLQKKIDASDIITLLHNENNLPTLSVIVTPKGELKAVSRSTTGDAFSNWTTTIPAVSHQMLAVRFDNLNNMSYGFKMGDLNATNNLCLTVSAAPAFAAGNTNGGNSVSGGTNPATNTQSATTDSTPNTATGLQDVTAVSPNPDPAVNSTPNQNVLQSILSWFGNLFK